MMFIFALYALLLVLNIIYLIQYPYFSSSSGCCMCCIYAIELPIWICSCTCAIVLSNTDIPSIQATFKIVLYTSLTCSMIFIWNSHRKILFQWGWLHVLQYLICLQGLIFLFPLLLVNAQLLEYNVEYSCLVLLNWIPPYKSLSLISLSLSLCLYALLCVVPQWNVLHSQ